MKIDTTKLSILCIRKGWNTMQLAEKAGITRQTLSTVKGRGTCAMGTAGKLAKALGVDVTELLEA